MDYNALEWVGIVTLCGMAALVALFLYYVTKGVRDEMRKRKHKIPPSDESTEGLVLDASMFDIEWPKTMRRSVTIDLLTSRPDSVERRIRQEADIFLNELIRKGLIVDPIYTVIRSEMITLGSMYSDTYHIDVKVIGREP